LYIGLGIFGLSWVIIIFFDISNIFILKNEDLNGDLDDFWREIGNSISKRIFQGCTEIRSWMV
jgi:hypothetical protein